MSPHDTPTIPISDQPPLTVWELALVGIPPDVIEAWIAATRSMAVRGCRHVPRSQGDS